MVIADKGVVRLTAIAEVKTTISAVNMIVARVLLVAIG
jgi:hypothetical protein